MCSATLTRKNGTYPHVKDWSGTSDRCVSQGQRVVITGVCGLPYPSPPLLQVEGLGRAEVGSGIASAGDQGEPWQVVVPAGGMGCNFFGG